MLSSRATQIITVKSGRISTILWMARKKVSGKTILQIQFLLQSILRCFSSTAIDSAEALRAVGQEAGHRKTVEE